MKTLMRDFWYQLFTDIGATTFAVAVILAPLGALMRSEGMFALAIPLAIPALVIFVRVMDSPPKPRPPQSIYSFLAVTWGVGIPLFLAAIALYSMLPDVLGVAPLPLER